MLDLWGHRLGGWALLCCTALYVTWAYWSASGHLLPLPTCSFSPAMLQREETKMVLSERVLDSYYTWLSSLSASARQEDGRSRVRGMFWFWDYFFPFYWSYDVKSWDFITNFFFFHFHKAQVKQKSTHASGDYCQFANNEVVWFFSSFQRIWWCFLPKFDVSTILFNV